MKYKVSLNYKIEKIVEAEDEYLAQEEFCEQLQNECEKNNEELINRVWETIRARRVR